MSESASETPVLDLLAAMTADSIEASSLDAETLALVRIAALVAVDAPAVSYLLNLAIAGEIGVDAEQVRGVLAAVAPIVGTARVASATGNIAQALEVAIEVAEMRRAVREPPGRQYITEPPTGDAGLGRRSQRAARSLPQRPVFRPLQPGLLPAGAARRLHGRRSAGAGLTSDTNLRIEEAPTDAPSIRLDRPAVQAVDPRMVSL